MSKMTAELFAIYSPYASQKIIIMLIHDSRGGCLPFVQKSEQRKIETETGN